MCDRVFPIVILAVFLMPHVDATAQDDHFSTTLKTELDYFECQCKNTGRRVVLREEDKSRFPKCVEWEKVSIKLERSLKFDQEAYSYDAGTKVPRANHFLSDATKQIFDVDFPSVAGVSPIKVNAFYENFRKYGWIEASKTKSKVGSLAIWPNFGGIVLSDMKTDSSDGGNAELADGSRKPSGMKILYPSHAKNGRLRVIDAKYLCKKDLPKFLVPRSYVTRKHPESGKKIKAEPPGESNAP
ncbi:hypothetical protein ACFL1X_01585 [Candidatus Hydrogenedentota bacterium]